MIPRHWLWWVAACTVFSQCEGNFYGGPTRSEFEVQVGETLRFSLAGKSPNSTIIIRNYDKQVRDQSNTFTVWMCGKCLANFQLPPGSFYRHNFTGPGEDESSTVVSGGGDAECTNWTILDRRRPEAELEFYRGYYWDKLHFRTRKGKPKGPILYPYCDDKDEMVIKPVHKAVTVTVDCETSGVFTRRGWLEYDEGILRVAHPTDRELFCWSHDDIQHQPLTLHYSDSQKQETTTIDDDLVQLCREVTGWWQWWKRFELKLDHPDKRKQLTVSGNISDGYEIDEFTNLKISSDITMKFVKQGITWRVDYCYGGITRGFLTLLACFFTFGSFSMVLVICQYCTRDWEDEDVGPEAEIEHAIEVEEHNRIVELMNQKKDARKEGKRLVKLHVVEQREKAKLQRRQEKKEATTSV